MFGWDINKLVEGATALVNDAQQDIASWDRREDATEVSASPDPAGSARHRSIDPSNTLNCVLIRLLRVRNFATRNADLAWHVQWLV